MEKNVWGVLIQKKLGILGIRKIWGEFTIGKNQVVNTKFSIY